MMSSVRVEKKSVVNTHWSACENITVIQKVRITVVCGIDFYFYFFIYLSLFCFCPTGPAAKAPKQEPGTGDAPPAGEEEEKKKQKRGVM